MIHLFFIFSYYCLLYIHSFITHFIIKFFFHKSIFYYLIIISLISFIVKYFNYNIFIINLKQKYKHIKLNNNFIILEIYYDNINLFIFLQLIKSSY